ncbi:hypothetical protein [Sporomusa aerivorans]|uniref:hypothetical protein n=1 Tax=Sporomusa aerivorans TaxID=204936 RepID=UPI00352A1681
MLAQTISSTLQEPSGLQLLLLENTIDETVSLASGFPSSVTANEPPHQSGSLGTARTPIHRQLISLCLNNPYWNDFRLLHHCQRRDTSITMKHLQVLKAQCGLDNRESICNTLIKLSLHGGLKLSDRQISFIEKCKPEFRDRDLQPLKPGELLVYECLFGRGMGKLGRVYVHFFIDIFTGYAFGAVSQQRSLEDGLDILLHTILPLYLAHNYPVHTVLHSSRVVNDIKEYNELEAAETYSRRGLHWVPTRRKFGAVEKFEKSFLANRFLENARKNADSLSSIQPLLNQCLLKYNSSNRLFAKRLLLED